MERLTKYQIPKGGVYRKYPCFSQDIIPDDNCPELFCEKAKQCNLTHINSRKCPYLRVIDRLAAYEDTMSIERAQELAQAEKDERLVMLPCKSGQTIWVESWIKGRVTSIEAPDITWIIENTERFDKEIFLTRAEAEAALKKRKEDDNESD